MQGRANVLHSSLVPPKVGDLFGVEGFAKPDCCSVVVPPLRFVASHAAATRCLLAPHSTEMSFLKLQVCAGAGSKGFGQTLT